MAVPLANPEIETYAETHTTPEPPYLQAVAEATRAFSEAHSMMVGRLEGRFLEMLVGITGARRILEIGTFTGYSALSMAEALPADGRIVTCDINPRHAAKALEHFAASPHAAKIELREGPALDTIRSLDGTFDLVFIDADKTGYHDYYETVLPLLSPRGVVVVDNVLWSGRVLDPSDDDESTRALAEFNDMVVADPRVDCVMLPIRDGVSLIRLRA
jgi:caffeoyl-CoA O-methyltransferase